MQTNFNFKLFENKIQSMSSNHCILRTHYCCTTSKRLNNWFSVLTYKKYFQQTFNLSDVKVYINIISVIPNLPTQPSTVWQLNRILHSCVTRLYLRWSRVNYQTNICLSSYSRVLTYCGAAVSFGDSEEGFGLWEVGLRVEQFSEPRLELGADGGASHGRRRRVLAASAGVLEEDTQSLEII